MHHTLSWQTRNVFKNLILRQPNLSHAILVNLFFSVILKHLSSILFDYKLETLGSDDGVCLDGGRELGEMGRGRHRMTRKLTLRSSGRRGRLHNKLSGAFGILVKVWHSFRDRRNLLVESFDDDDIPVDELNFSSFTMQTPRKTKISLMTAMDRST